MRLAFPIPMGRKRPGLRRLIQERAWVRHPVSVRRQRMSAGLLAALCLGFGLYLFNTRDAAIHRRVIEFLTDVSSGEVKIGSAQFHMFGGITLNDVRIAVPFDERLDSRAVEAPARQIFFASSVTLIHNPWRLLLGSLRVDQVIAARPEIRLVHNVDTGIRNWQLLTGPRPSDRTPRGAPPRPRITIRSARVIAVSVYEDGKREERAEELDADVRPHLASETGFAIEVRRFSDPAERTTVVFDPTVKMVKNTPYVDARTVRLQLPKVAQQFFDKIGLDGEAKLGRLFYDRQRSESIDLEVELRRVRCAVPLSMLRSGQATSPGNADAGSKIVDEPAATLTDAMGRLALRSGRLDVDLTGQFNGARCSLKGTLSGVERPLAEMGLDVRIVGAKVPAPEDAARERVLTDPAVPPEIKSFFHDYDPHGEFDLDVRLTRPTGPAGQIALFGVIRPLRARGNCVHFPYELDELTGQVRVEGPRVYLEELSGRHKGAVVRINSVIDVRTEWADVGLDIAATDVSLDDDLFASLSEHDRSIWKTFDPRGTTDLSLHLVRPGGAADAARPHWVNKITADLRDAKIRFSEYPYPLEQVEGRIHLDGDRMQFVGVTGRRGNARIKVDGESVIPTSGRPSVELKIDATGVPLDRVLADSLPAEGRGAFEQFQPQGLIDLSGTVSLQPTDDAVRYDLRAKVSDAAIRYRQFPYPIQDVNGEVLIRPEGFSVLHVNGRHGETKIEAHGDVRRFPDGYGADLVFRCLDLPLDQEVYDALPESLKEVWRRVQPAGSVDIETSLHRIARANEEHDRHRSRLRAKGASFCFEGLPLKVTDASGDLIVTDRKIEMHALSGRVGGGSLLLSGEIDLQTGGRRGTLVVDAQKLAFNKPLIGALPPRFRDILSSIHATGGFDLRLDPIQFEADGDGRTRWAFGGKLTVRDASAQMGITIEHASGTLSGEGRIEAEGELGIVAAAELSQAVLAGWELQNVTGRVMKEPEQVKLDIRDVAAEGYGGQATGAAQVQLGGTATEYQVSVVTRDVQLGKYLAATTTAPTDNKVQAPSAGATARGTLDGNILIRGRTGNQGYREGSGVVFVRSAEVWRMPLVFLIFQVLNLTPDENVFHDGWLEFDIAGRTLTFKKIDLQGRALSLAGSGKMDLTEKSMDIVLTARSPVRIRIPLLTDALELFSREIMEIRVTGSVNTPTIRPQPLRSLGIIFKALFAPLAPKSKPPTTTQPGV